MEKVELVKVLARKLDVTPEIANSAVDMVVAEIVSPHIFVRPGGEVGLLDNSCTNNCKEEIARPLGG